MLMTALANPLNAFVSLSLKDAASTRRKIVLNAKPRRLADNVDGPLYVNEKVSIDAASKVFLS